VRAPVGPLAAVAAVSVLDRAATPVTELAPAAPVRALDAAMQRLVTRRAAFPRRGWLVRRALLLSDVLGLTAAFVITGLGDTGSASGAIGSQREGLLFALSLPAWVLLAKLHGLYDRDEERADHSTVDEITGVAHVVTLGTWSFFAASLVTGLATPEPGRLIVFWGLAIAVVALARAVARGLCRRSVAYLQNTIVIGDGEVGQLIARKVLKHHEYGLNLVGFVGADPRQRRSDLGHVAYFGGLDQLGDVVDKFDVERVIVAFSRDSDQRTLEAVRSLRDRDVQVDVVPRLFELVGPRVDVHTVEGLSLIGLPPSRLSRSSQLLKRAFDILGASLALLLTAPLWGYLAWRIRRDSPGPVLFRQTRLGLGMRPFTALKFRTMKVGTRDDEHRAYISRTMTASATAGSNGMFKLDRDDAVTPVGRWLRKTSLDELPQLLNVLRGDMSLVGPRPCLAYETEHFEGHHFERFNLPPGITGLWQVTARANSTFGEALEMDVAYVHGWSLGLDLRLLFRTPLALLRQRKATA
jgi:exopolysaccharide biosynthesis polyprenyl glycosylphosphotransferase